MLKILDYEVTGWKWAIEGMRNPLNSWEKSDSHGGKYYIAWDKSDPHGGKCYIGDKDFKLMKKLAAAGSDHRKFMRMITVYVSLSAPLYWWKEADTYKVGTVRNSCSTMHKIQDKVFTTEDFSNEHLSAASEDLLVETITYLNHFRKLFIETKEADLKKIYWWQMIQSLPSSYNQRATLMLNYEVLRNMYHSRKNHKLDEWHQFCDWIETLPCSELITGEE